MKTKFELVAEKNKMDVNKSLEYFKEVIDEGNGFVMIYRNKNDNRYYMMFSGFTSEETIYASHLIANGVDLYPDEDDPSGIDEDIVMAGGG